MSFARSIGIAATSLAFLTLVQASGPVDCLNRESARALVEPAIPPELDKLLLGLKQDLRSAAVAPPGVSADAHNRELLSQLKRFTPVPNPRRIAAANLELAARIHARVRALPLIQSLLAQLQRAPSEPYGLCIGESMAVHLEAIRQGIQKESIRKIWAVGGLKGPGMSEFHVATLIQAEGGGWWAIDPRMESAVPVDDWAENILSHSVTGKTRLFVTEAKRFALSSPRQYTRRYQIDPHRAPLLMGGLEDPSYRGFFMKLLEQYRRDFRESGIRTFRTEDNALRKPD